MNSTPLPIPVFHASRSSSSKGVTSSSRPPRRPEIFLDLTAEALRALAFLHEFDLIHRDLKPANLLVRDTPKLGCRLVIVDFGLALQAADQPAEAFRVAGTLPYVAPELLANRAASRRSDLYALGAVFRADRLRPAAVVLGEEAGASGSVREIADTPARAVAAARGISGGVERLALGAAVRRAGAATWRNAADALAASQRVVRHALSGGNARDPRGAV